ncbi:hypothetical protein HK405_001957, partial [Cladochytrium tenue]
MIVHLKTAVRGGPSAPGAGLGKATVPLLQLRGRGDVKRKARGDVAEPPAAKIVGTKAAARREDGRHLP